MSARRLAALAVPVLATAAPQVAAPPAIAVSTGVVVAEVYGGGGNSGAFYRSDFIELGNASAAAIDLDGWRVQ